MPRIRPRKEDCPEVSDEDFVAWLSRFSEDEMSIMMREMELFKTWFVDAGAGSKFVRRRKIDWRFANQTLSQARSTVLFEDATEEGDLNKLLKAVPCWGMSIVVCKSIYEPAMKALFACLLGSFGIKGEFPDMSSACHRDLMILEGLSPVHSLCAFSSYEVHETLNAMFLSAYLPHLPALLARGAGPADGYEMRVSVIVARLLFAETFVYGLFIELSEKACDKFDALLDSVLEILPWLPGTDAWDVCMETAAGKNECATALLKLLLFMLSVRKSYLVPKDVIGRLRRGIHSALDMTEEASKDAVLLLDQVSLFAVRGNNDLRERLQQKHCDLIKQCVKPDCAARGDLRCSRCLARYCCKDHQRQHFREHKLVCIAPQLQTPLVLREGPRNAFLEREQHRGFLHKDLSRLCKVLVRIDDSLLDLWWQDDETSDTA